MEDAIPPENNVIKPFSCDENLIIDLQNTYSSMNKSLDDINEINNLKDIIVGIIHKRDLQRNEIDLAFKIYYRTLQKLKIRTDTEFFENLNKCSFNHQPFIINAIIITNFQKHLEKDSLIEICNKIFLRCVLENSKNLIVILKAMNLLNKRYPESKFNISLDNVYFCLQNNTSFRIRDEILQLFERYVQRSPEEACEIVFIVLNYMPWTNKNKFYILSIIFKVYSYEFVKTRVEFENEEFFEGIRLALTFKHLFSAAQCLIRSLNNLSNEIFIEFILKLFENASEKEMVNLNSQWWKHIENREQIYFKLNMDNIFRNVTQSSSGTYRNILICYLFRSNILKSDENTFYKILIYFIDHYGKFDEKAQLFIYKFITDTLSNVNLMERYGLFNDIMNFFVGFFKVNIYTSLPDFRQSILEKVPDIINFASKILHWASDTASAKSVQLINEIEIFFRNIIEIYECGISLSNEYQPIIFSLKLFNQTLKTIYLKPERINVKNLTNQKLIEFLNEKSIFDFKKVQIQLLQLLDNDLVQYDDVQAITVNIINSINLISSESPDYEAILENCKIKCKSLEYNKCCKASIIASLIVDKNLDANNRLYEFCINNLSNSFKNFEQDPLLMCKTVHHLFGFINCLNILFSTEKQKYLFEDYENVIEICFDINKIILKLLKIANENIDENTSASFEIMDESLDLLLQKSKIKTDNSILDRKLLLLSFWTTLKATCDMATTIGINLFNLEKEDCLKLDLFEKCLDININVLCKCRHKGAIEAAGISLGILVKHTTNLVNNRSKFYKKLFKCFDMLFSNVSNNSLTRRGAGLSIMLHHLLKNDMDKSKLLFYHGMKIIMSHVQKNETPIEEAVLISTNGENFDALMLHYLCVLVKDTELKDYVAEFYDDIMMAAIKRIEHREWCVRNAALQLFGGIVPKMVGQKQSSDIETPLVLYSSEVTLREISIKVPKTLFYILKYCYNICNDTTFRNQKSYSTIILFLEFLSNIEYLKLNFSNNNTHTEEILLQYRELFWKLLSHKCEKIRKLSATCLVSFHDLNDEIMNLILSLIKTFNIISEPNFEQGLLYALISGINKIKNGKYLNKNYEESFLLFRTYFIDNFRRKKLSYYK
ncbi:uncharacterized protein LOC129613948 [Condylostylus longicornis]|uniref:uncharacterized protein LOC129613948 n=1 Tax=Condylostylus longicornis TaxID=2530218 RepID=UPI00244DC304|nr:uncharacterized protein LOC129613948 [Condylostylus longicornis]